MKMVLKVEIVGVWRVKRGQLNSLPLKIPEVSQVLLDFAGEIEPCLTHGFVDLEGECPKGSLDADRRQLPASCSARLHTAIRWSPAFSTLLNRTCMR